MQLWQTDISAARNKLHDSPVVATMGNFDGVHVGHRRLISTAVRMAKERCRQSVLITFNPHPMKVIAQSSHSGLLMTLSQKLNVLESLGVDYVWLIPFNLEFSELAPEVFLELLGRYIIPAEIHVGQAFRFGRDRTGDITTMQNWGDNIGCQVHAHAYLAPDGGILSSSRIRQALATGDADLASELLGAPYKMSGMVVEGSKRGRELGFPTANLQWEQEFIPANGVYITKVSCPTRLNEPSLGLTNIGEKPTFGSQQQTIETHLLGINTDLYGANIELELLHRIRGEQKFDNPESLIIQIAEDIEHGIRWWKLNC
ncbi:MAG: riboflavin biosynthesis protein RibF [Holophagaceae bacterium]|nr:riboflavin biosynthesis protein RibF [Holophagaceae bacterium]